MTFEEYQKQSAKTASYKQLGLGLAYPALGLAGETGEVVEKVKKIFRDGNGVADEDRSEELAKELGDVLWYLAQLATDLELDLDDIAAGNLEKTMSRMNRDKIHGDGDNR